MWIERLDVAGNVSRPVVDDRSVAALAARLVAQLPGENGRAVSVPRYEDLDVVPVDFLGYLALEEARPAICLAVRVESAEVGPVVHEGQN